jgi:hypothetical protein
MHMSEETQTPQTNTNEVEDNFSVNDEWQAKDAAAAARRLDAQRLTQAQPESDESSLFGKRPGLAITGLVGVAALGVGGLVALEGGSPDGAERGTTDASIASITLNPDAHLRLDPYVGDPKNNTANDALQLGAKVTIDANRDIRVLNGTSNGTWYGIPIDEVKAVAPSASSINDKDGILWVNEQGVENVAKTDLSTQ